MNPIENTYRYLVDWMNAKGEMVQNTIAATSMQDAMTELQEIEGTPFYMNEDQHEKWKHTDLTIDAVKGIGGMFSLDNGTGRRFLTKSEICLVKDEKTK